MTFGKNIATVAAALQAAACLARLCVPLAMQQFGVILPGVGTMHYPATAGGVAALLQMVATYAETHSLCSPVLLLLVNGTVAWCYTSEKGAWKRVKDRARSAFKSKL